MQVYDFDSGSGIPWLTRKLKELSKQLDHHNEELRGILERLEALEGRAGIVAKDKDGEA